MADTQTGGEARAAHSEAERLMKLAIFVREHGPVGFTTIRKALDSDDEYAVYRGSDPDARRMHEDKIRRRFERDKATLAEKGIWLAASGDHTYTIDSTRSTALPVELADDEVSLLRVLGGALLEDDEYPFKSELREVLVKLSHELEIPDLLPNMEDTRATEAIPGLRKIRTALAKRKRIAFDYCDAKGRQTHREVEPFGCFFYNGHCYIASHDLTSDGERVFRLDRMRHLKVNRKRPNDPDFPERPFDAARYLGLPFQYGGTPFEAKIGLDADNAWRFERLNMHQGAAEQGDGGLIWTVRANDVGALAQWCIENGPGVAPLEPEEARVEYERLIRGSLRAIEENRENR